MCAMETQENLRYDIGIQVAEGLLCLRSRINTFCAVLNFLHYKLSSCDHFLLH
jgi:hypothetical protein